MNKLGIASLIVVALGGITLVVSSARKAEENPPAKVSVELPTLKVDDIDELELAAPDKPKLRLQKRENVWHVVEPVEDEADDNAVKTALAKLGELEVTGVAATLPKNHEKLEVDDKQAVRVIAKAAGKPLLDAYIGAYRSGSTMLRLHGQDPVAAVRGSIRFAFAKETREWRDRQINDTPTDSAQAMTFANTNGRLRFERDGDGWKQVLGKGEKAIDPLDVSKVKGILGTASSLSATDFAEPGANPDELGLSDGAATLVLDLKDDSGERQVVYRIGNQQDQNYYLRKDGDDTIYVVSAWIGGRLLASRDTFLKKKEEAPEGSRENPIQVMPQAMQPGMAMPQGMAIPQMPQGHP